MADDDRTTVIVSVDNVPFGKVGVRIAFVGMSYTLTTFEARRLADELLRVADEAEEVAL